MEKGPEIRIVGGASTEKKEQTKKRIKQFLFNQFESLSPEQQRILKKFEYPKSEKMFALIDFVNEETSRLMQEAGIKPYDVPPENFHIIPPELYKEIAAVGGTGMVSITKQGIFFNGHHVNNNPVSFGATAFHELLHLKAHLSMEVQEEGDEVTETPYRSGLEVITLQSHRYNRGEHRHFAGLHEAIVAETEKRFLRKLLNHPKLTKEKEWLNSDEAKKMKTKLAKKKGIPEDNIIWFGKEGENDWEVVSYLQQRNVLNYVCAEIHKHFPGQYQNADDVYKVFLNAHFTGSLLPIGRLVEKTFGEGSFRLLGNMDTNKESGVLHLESLKKARAIQARKKANP